MISVIDYGAGNLRSMANALRLIGADISIEKSLSKDASAIILPGVGNFGDCLSKLDSERQRIIDAIDSGTPFLGVCVGLQALLEGSTEAKDAKGFGFFKGDCLKFDVKKVPGGKVPHMGWNSVSELKSPLFEGIKENEDFYFVHSYYAPLMPETIAVCEYGMPFSAALEKKNVYATQFHPERSGAAGLKILENFLKLSKK